jgi:hypothetical protein
MNKLFLVTAILFFSGINLRADSGWQLKKDEEGIKIYVKHIEGSAFKAYKGVTTVKDKSLTDVLNVIFDIKNYNNLFPDASGSRLIKKFDKYHNIHYLQIHTPWPASDRDNVTEIEAKISEDGKSAHVDIVSRPDYIPPEEDLVRAYGKGFWELKETPEGDVIVTYQYHGNPGGSVPAWLANSFVISHPFETLKNLHKRLDK